MWSLSFINGESFSDEVIAVACGKASPVLGRVAQSCSVIPPQRPHLVCTDNVELATTSCDLRDPGRDVLVQVELHALGLGRMKG